MLDLKKGPGCLVRWQRWLFLDPDVCSVVEAWLFGVVAAVALLGSEVCFGAETWLFGEAVGLAFWDTEVCFPVETLLFGEVVGWLCWMLMFVGKQRLGF